METKFCIFPDYFDDKDVFVVNTGFFRQECILQENRRQDCSISLRELNNQTGF